MGPGPRAWRHGNEIEWTLILNQAYYWAKDGGKMALKCLFGHKLNGCTCTRCGKKLDEGHDWQPVAGKCTERCSICRKIRSIEHDWGGCKCRRCDLKRNENHLWDGCVCRICGKNRDQEHDWNGCICNRCAKERNEQHDWNRCKCARCGKIGEGGHDWQRAEGKYIEQCIHCGQKRAVVRAWIGNVDVLPANKDELDEIVSPEMLPVGSVIRLYSSSLPYLLSPGWLGGWRKVDGIDYVKNRISLLELGTGKSESRVFGDTFYGYGGSTHMHCFSAPSALGASVPISPAAAEPKINPSALPASKLIDYLREHPHDSDVLSLCRTLTAKLKDGFYARPEDVAKALRTFGDEGMVARFNQIRNTMKPSDLDSLILDVMRRYLQYRS